MKKITSFKTTNHLEYRALCDKELRRFPDNVRLVVWLIVNVEYWDIQYPMARAVLPPPAGQFRLPDIANWGWHEYGMRRGFWRLKDALDKLGIVPTLSINGHVCDAYPQIAQASKDADWEFMGHGFIQRPMHDFDDEAQEIAKTISRIHEFTGKAPLGWLGPGLTETEKTLNLLSDAGIQYVCDWAIDDLPVDLNTTSGVSMTALPYSVELNDIPGFAIQSQPTSVFEKRCIDQFDRLYAESEHVPRIVSLAVHPFLSGVPHRIGYFERVLKYFASKPNVEFWTGEKILAWHKKA